MASTTETDGLEGSTSIEHVDVTSSPHSLHHAVYARRSEYVRPHRIQVKIGTWNVAASPGTDKDLASWFISGKGIDQRLANLDLSNDSAVERQSTSDSAEDESDTVRLVGGDKIGLYVLGLQEVMDLNVASQYVRSAYSDTGMNPLDRWRMAMEAALPPGYQHVASEQMSGLILLIYASPEVAPTIGNVSTVSTGTGLFGYMGNKGAVTTRMVLGETTRMVFVNCHLASGNDTSYLERRCWDVNQILSRTQFEPVSHAGVQEDESEKIGDEDFIFWFGDLNFRLDGLPGDDIRHLLMLHTRGEYGTNQKSVDEPIDGEAAIVLRSSSSSDDQPDSDSTSAKSGDQSADETSASLPDPDDFLPDPSDDPASLQTTLDSLLSHDQLRRMMRDDKVFHDGWREGPITFLPSYKYDVGTVGLFDSSEKRRAPSWCDRILFRTRKDKADHEKRVEDGKQSRKRDEEMKARGIDHAGDEDEVLFNYDPETDGEDHHRETAEHDYDEYDDGPVEDAEEVITKEGFTDRIRQDIYTSHQRIQSSDHKPVISIFTLDYDAVVADLKGRVHAEVARELDRAENEGRPGITIVVDGQDAIAEQVDGTAAPPCEGVSFGDVEYLQKKSSSLTIANTGRVPATFSFVEKPTTDEGDGGDNPQWLTTSFVRPDPGADGDNAIDLGKEVTLEPGETVNALLEALVDNLRLVRLLNDGQCALDDVLVLRVTSGRDHFMPVKASWSPTCIGRSIDELIRVPDGGIRPFILSRSQENHAKGSIPYELDVHCAAPKELFKLTEAVEVLAERVLADEQMLDETMIPKEKAGWPFEGQTRELENAQVSRVIDALDYDKPINSAFHPETSSLIRLETVSHALLLFLQGLTDGIVSVPLWTRIDQASLASLGHGSPSKDSSDEDDKTTVLDVLSSAPNHNISFVFLTTTLAKIISELTPLSKTDLEALKSTGRGIGSIGRRSLSLRKSGPTASSEALAALDKRQAKEKRFAEIFGKAACRIPHTVKDKEKKAVEDKQRALLQLFFRRRNEDAG